MSLRHTPFILFFTIQIAHAQTLDIQGHRGARGLMPENTIPAFIKAIELGVTTIELDVVVSKDQKLVVSHEPWMSADICNVPDNNKVRNNIYQMNYSDVAAIDCGNKYYARFATQQKMAVAKPLLEAVIDTVEKLLRNSGKTVYYNIETKCTPEGDGVFHPEPEAFASLLYNLLKSKQILSRCIIQSFDVRTLQAVKKIDNAVVTALLVFNTDGYEKNLLKLGYKPEIYSPNFALVNSKLIRKCHAEGVRIIPWTVNDEKKMKQLKRMGVDGIITDYPDKAINTL